MRKISMAKVGDYQKMMLNNEFVFQMGPLDQGFWPDGLYTAPTDEALKSDIEASKKLGFNMVRKHIKVEPYRWYYWADKLGLMVWQDMPSANSYTDVHPPVDEVAYESELVRMIENHWNSPSIIMWVVFNEGQGQHNTPGLVSEVTALDPSRLVNQASGWGHEGVGDVLDVHSYPPPGCPNNNGTQTLACGEFGGIGFSIPGHIWNPGFGYVWVYSATQLLKMYDDFANLLVHYKTNQGLSAAVYTDITDVELELNGFLTYDRSMYKATASKVAAINEKIINKNLYMTAALPAAPTASTAWSFTTKEPAANWYAPDYVPTGWYTGFAGFGSNNSSVYRHASWTTSDIWLRKSFDLGTLTASALDSLVLYINHDENCEVYINGVLAASLTGFTGNYVIADISAQAKSALKSNAKNVIAIHCNQTIGGQYIDCGIYQYSFDKAPLPLAVKTGSVPEMGIYPNPAVDNLHITGFGNEEITASVFNSVGKLILQKKGNFDALNVSDLSEGVYLIKIDGQTESRNFKFTKVNN
jgi:hypothetical protein